MKIRFSANARGDVQDIADYTFENWGSQQEEFYLSSLYKRLQEISQEPQRWRKREDLFANCQMAPLGKHLIFFRAQDGLILVSRILHQSMDVGGQEFPLREEEI